MAGEAKDYVLNFQYIQYVVVQPPDLDVPARAQQQRQPRGLHQRGHRRVRRLGQAEVAPVQQGRDHPPPLRQVPRRGR